MQKQSGRVPGFHKSGLSRRAFSKVCVRFSSWEFRGVVTSQLPLPKLTTWYKAHPHGAKKTGDAEDLKDSTDFKKGRGLPRPSWGAHATSAGGDLRFHGAPLADRGGQRPLECLLGDQIHNWNFQQKIPELEYSGYNS